MEARVVREYFELSQDSVALVDRQLRFRAANPQYCRYWGVERERLPGVGFQDVTGTALGKEHREYLTRCLDGVGTEIAQWVHCPGVGRRHLDMRYIPQRDDSGEVAGVCIIARDTTSEAELRAEVRLERDRLEQILSSLKVGLWLLDEDLTVEWANEHLRAMFPGIEPVGASCFRIFGGDSQPCPDCPAHDPARRNEVCSTEVHLADSDRTYVMTRAPLSDRDGRVTRFLGHVADVTGQRRSQKALKKKEAQLESIFRATQVGIGMVKDRIITQVNDYVFDLLGYTREELMGEPSRRVYASDEAYRKAGQDVYGRIRGDKTVSIESQWRRKDGEVLDVLVTVTFLNPDDPMEGATFVAMDITERKRAEDAIRESEHRFRSIFEGVPTIAVQGYDPQLRVVYWNPASERLYGYSRDEAMGQRLVDLIIPEHLSQSVATAHREWINGGPPIPSAELELVHKDGSLAPVYSSHIMQETASGEKLMYCLDVDLSEIKRIHNRLVKAKEEAEEANLAKSAFLANMSHEIRTPLNGIQGMFSLLQMTQLDKDQAEYAQAGIDSAKRLNRLLSDILDLSRVEVGKLSLVKEKFNLPKLLGQFEDLFTPLFAEKGLRFAVSLDRNLPDSLVGDSARLHQVLTNIVSNSLKYTEKGGVELEVSLVGVRRPGVYRILFSVADTGIGIPDSVLESVFEPFTQGSQGYARQFQGAGLGLSICRRLVSLMGGNMAVESEPGRGSTFHIVMPFREDLEPPRLLAKENAEIGLVAVQLRVLLAEDDRVNSLVGQRLLEKAGCSVTVVSTGEQALEAIRREEFAVVFMDVQMPDMDGVEATRHIRAGAAGEENRDILIFALTAYTMAGDRERFLQCGMDGYVPKPVEMEDIVRVLRTAIRRQRDAL